MEFLSRFQYMITHVEGRLNKVADCLSRNYENTWPDEIVLSHNLVNADVRLDPDHVDLSPNRVIELRAMMVDRNQALPKDRIEDREREAELLRIPGTSSANNEPTPAGGDEDIALSDALMTGPPLQMHLEREVDFLQSVRSGYQWDKLLRLVKTTPNHYPTFQVKDNLVYMKNRQGTEVLCIL